MLPTSLFDNEIDASSWSAILKIFREDILNVFKFDPDYLENEAKYEEVKKELLGEDSDEESGSGSIWKPSVLTFFFEIIVLS